VQLRSPSKESEPQPLTVHVDSVDIGKELKTDEDFRQEERKIEEQVMEEQEQNVISHASRKFIYHNQNFNTLF